MAFFFFLMSSERKKKGLVAASLVQLFSRLELLLEPPELQRFRGREGGVVAPVPRCQTIFDSPPTAAAADAVVAGLN